MLNYVKSCGIILGALLILGTAGAARADDWCYKHVRHQQHELDEAIHDHGYNSWQADRERRKLDQIRDQCRYRAERNHYRYRNGDGDYDQDDGYYRYR
jgi:hypothetical protein